MASVDQLPNEIFIIIVQKLDFMCRKRTRLISKRFKSIVDSIIERDLCICNSHEYDSLANSWFMTYESIRHKNMLWNIDLSSGPPPSNQLYETIKRLKLNITIDCKKFEIKTIEKFNLLEQLEIKSLENVMNEMLNLRHLHTIFIGSAIGDEEQYLVLNAPRLRSVYFGDDVMNLVRLIHFNSIKYIELHGAGDFSDLFHLKNVEIVKCNRVHLISSDFIYEMMRLPKLVELHCNSRGLWESQVYSSSPTNSDVEKLRVLFDFLLKQIKISRKLNFKFYLDGVLIKGTKKFNEYEFGREIMSLHMNNYGSLARCFPWYQDLCYDRLADATAYQIPNDICLLYPNIKSVFVNEYLLKECGLIDFLNKCTNLAALHITNAPLSQKFFDQIPDLNCELKQLHIFGCNQILDLKFLFEMEFLENFGTDQQFSVDSSISLLRKIKYYLFLRFRVGQDNVIIGKKGRNMYDIKSLNFDLGLTLG